MKMISIVIAIILCTGMSANAKDCSQEENSIQIIACHEDRYLAADQELNAVYKEIMKSLSPDAREKFKQAQRAWLKYRDASIALISEIEKESGSYGGVVIANYKAKIVEKRVLELKHVFSGPEGASVEGW